MKYKKFIYCDSKIITQTIYYDKNNETHTLVHSFAQPAASCVDIPRYFDGIIYDCIQEEYFVDKTNFCIYHSIWVLKSTIFVFTDLEIYAYDMDFNLLYIKKYENYVWKLYE